MSYQHKVNSNTIVINFNYKKSSYLSNLNNTENGLTSIDELHKNRKHKDLILNVWYLFKYGGYKNKVSISFRNRSTKSPYRWVEDLKSFDKIYLEYTVYFDTLSAKHG